MNRAETFTIVLVVLCVAALGIGVAMEAVRHAMLRSRQTVTRGRIDRRRNELEDAEKRADAREAEADKAQRELESLSADRLRTLSLMKTVAADKIEMVHELGSADQTSAAFQSPLTPSADVARLEERRVMFHRDIWKHRNTAWIWADTAEEASAALARVFATRSAISFRPPTLHPEMSKIPAPVKR